MFRRTLLGSLLLFSATSVATAQTAQDRLWDAAKAGDTAAIRAAVEDGAVIDSLDVRASVNGRCALNWAAWYDHVPAIELLLELGAPIEAVNLTGFSALHHAAESDSRAAAVALLAAGADPEHANNEGRTPRWTAVDRGNGEIVALLDEAIRAADEP